MYDDQAAYFAGLIDFLRGLVSLSRASASAGFG